MDSSDMQTKNQQSTEKASPMPGNSGSGQNAQKGKNSGMIIYSAIILIVIIAAAVYFVFLHSNSTVSNNSTVSSSSNSNVTTAQNVTNSSTKTTQNTSNSTVNSTQQTSKTNTSSNNRAFLSPSQIATIIEPELDYTPTGNTTETHTFLNSSLTEIGYSKINNTIIDTLGIGVDRFSNTTAAQSLIKPINEFYAANTTVGPINMTDGTVNGMSYAYGKAIKSAGGIDGLAIVMYVSVNNTGILLGQEYAYKNGTVINQSNVLNISKGIELANAEYLQQLGKTLAYNQSG